MASLTAHLRESGDHGRLPFHPACPVCCEERLAGSLPADGVVGHRTQALLAAGVLAFSASAPASVMAAQGDEEFVGSGDPNAFTAPGSEPDAGPDGDREELPEDPDPAD